jgi:hypothetical protein
MFKQIALFTLATAFILSNVAVLACTCGARPAQQKTTPKNPPAAQKR